MRKLVSQLFVSLDGVVESPERWHLGYYNEEMQAAVDSQIVEADILLLGQLASEWWGSEAQPTTRLKT